MVYLCFLDIDLAIKAMLRTHHEHWLTSSQTATKDSWESDRSNWPRACYLSPCDNIIESWTDRLHLSYIGNWWSILTVLAFHNCLLQRVPLLLTNIASLCPKKLRANDWKLALLSSSWRRKMLNHHTQYTFLHRHPFCELCLDLGPGLPYFYHAWGVNRVNVLLILSNDRVKHQLNKHRLLPFHPRLLGNFLIYVVVVTPKVLL